MARVLGLGGIFFKCDDPVALGNWYKEYLDMPYTAPYGAVLKADMRPKDTSMVWTPFAADTQHFVPSTQPFMINLMVDDVEGVLARVREGGGTQVGEIESHDYGRFGWFMDPAGNKVELWEPVKK
jgi:predicted enzyme related to lactoylglutathione lyase